MTPDGAEQASAFDPLQKAGRPASRQSDRFGNFWPEAEWLLRNRSTANVDLQTPVYASMLIC